MLLYAPHSYCSYPDWIWTLYRVIFSFSKRSKFTTKPNFKSYRPLEWSSAILFFLLFRLLRADNVKLYKAMRRKASGAYFQCRSRSRSLSSLERPTPCILLCLPDGGNVQTECRDMTMNTFMRTRHVSYSERLAISFIDRVHTGTVSCESRSRRESLGTQSCSFASTPSEYFTAGLHGGPNLRRMGGGGLIQQFVDRIVPTPKGHIRHIMRICNVDATKCRLTQQEPCGIPTTS